MQEPGTGTQIHFFAAPPEDESTPNVYTINGRTWAVGREYWDADSRDLMELVGVIGRSTWCDTRDAEDQSPLLLFEGRYGKLRADPHRRDWDEDRFTLRSVKDPAGCAHEVWPGADS